MGAGWGAAGVGAGAEVNVITERYSLYEGDCLEVMKTFEANTFDSIICDPPYMLNFMGKAFDTSKDNIAARVELWQECLRVAKPGAHLLAFGGDRTHHRLMVAIEDAGWEIRTCIYWLFGSGFPKALNISKAIDAHLGAEREVIGEKFAGFAGANAPFGSKMQREQGYRPKWDAPSKPVGGNMVDITAPATDAAKEFAGWYSALKPAAEIIVVAMKPLTSTFAANALEWGCAGLNIDGCRIEANDKGGWRPNCYGKDYQYDNDGKFLADVANGSIGEKHPSGRWPANLILSQSAAALLDEMSGESKSTASNNRNGSNIQGVTGIMAPRAVDMAKGHNDSGGASRYFTVLPDSEPRFFYSAKASRGEREEGLDGLPEHIRQATAVDGDSMQWRIENGVPTNPKAPPALSRNHHPTVKNLELMKWLCRLSKTPTGGIVFDPFMGSGTTGIAAILEGRRFVGVEKEADYFTIAKHRMEHWQDEASTEPRKLRGKDSDLSGMPLFADIGG